jgi:glycosyltransferase involved in cell wall biosynthesis
MQIGIDASRTGVQGRTIRRTGTERYTLEIIRNLLALPQATQHHWRLYSNAPLPAEVLESLAAASSVRPEILVLPARRLWTHNTLRREVMRRPPDVLFIPAHVVPFVWPPSRLPPTVVTIHDLGYRHFPAAHTWTQRCYLQWSTRWSAHAAQRVIAVSKDTARDLVRFAEAPDAKIAIIHEGCTPDAPVKASAELQHRTLQHYGLERPYALYIGTIQPRKNLARVLQAYADLLQKGSLSWDLVLAGASGWMSQPIYALGNEPQMAGRVHFLGYVPDADLPALFQQACFFCFPSLFEGFGLPVLEAQQYGVPVMTANNSALPEIAGNAALLVDPTDIDAIAGAMLRLSQDEELRQRLIAAGYENVKRFSWEKAARETLAVLEQAAQAKKRQRHR